MYVNANAELVYQMNSQGVVTVDKRTEFASQITSIGMASICLLSSMFISKVSLNQLQELLT